MQRYFRRCRLYFLYFYNQKDALDNISLSGSLGLPEHMDFDVLTREDIEQQAEYRARAKLLQSEALLKAHYEDNLKDELEKASNTAKATAVATKEIRDAKEQKLRDLISSLRRELSESEAQCVKLAAQQEQLRQLLLYPRATDKRSYLLMVSD